jgi:GrpB-like predicted nucleotidyltransferase (UPF0157 family)
MSSPETIELSPYSPMWPAVFDIERGRLLEIFGADGVRIEHIGSTAIPDLGAKPIIDVLLGAAAMAIIDRAIPALEAGGYRYVPEFERSAPNRRYFVKTHGQPGHFHLHAVVAGTTFWNEHIAFRDALRADPLLAEKYWTLKRRLASRHRHDREAYTEAKSTFIRSVLDSSP